MEQLGTKAETLNRLYGQLQNAKVLPQLCFTVKEWENKKAKIVETFHGLEWNTSVVVRSSALSEDTASESGAGKYESVLDVSGEREFEAAVTQVIASYEDLNENNQILVQPMLKKVMLCGVAFTIDPNTLGHYYVINYDKTGSTSAVTSGRGTENFLYYQFKSEECWNGPADMQRICKALKELETFFCQENLDVEFAVTEEGIIYIMQVRSLCLKRETVDYGKQKNDLIQITEKIKTAQAPKPFLCGRKAIYSVMTDWNPAEMIGIRPKPLAMSLYREIITDSVWAYQRDNYGYRNLRSFPLMVDFCGMPYIDIRVSFNSFIPAELEEELSEKLVNYYIDRLTEHPQKHDKAEFEIVFSCYTLDLPERIQILKDYGFSEVEIQKLLDALRNVTNRIIDHENGLWRKDYGKIEILNKRYEEIMSSSLSDMEKVYWLLEDCKRYGTLPFAGLARGAFIAVQILQSLVKCGILSKQDYECFMNGVNTVSSTMNADFTGLSKDAFLKKYGHLRPGTYDINSLRYDEAPELYFQWGGVKNGQDKNENEEFRLSLHQLNELRNALSKNGLTNDILDLMDFIKTVIEGREYGKFAFTRNLSKAIQLIGEIGLREGISKDDSAFINIHAIYELFSSAKDIRESLLYSIQKGKCDYKKAQSVTLPPVILHPADAMRFYYPDSEPNYITSGAVRGETCVLGERMCKEDMEGRVILIPSADPGYDWIFSHRIGGFITMYGGANSHMAIRAGELLIPAVIGVGAKDFDRYSKAQILEIDAASKLVRILK